MPPGVKCWDQEKINLLFSGVVTKDILIVPLLDEIQEDRLIWIEEKDGLYSVRFSYRKLMEERNSRGRPRASQQGGNIWKVQDPPKAKHLMWRICKECLPTWIRLRNHYVQCQLDCPLCLQEPKEDCHLLLECEGSKEAWSSMGLNHIITPKLHLFYNVKDLIFYVCRKENKERKTCRIASGEYVKRVATVNGLIAADTVTTPQQAAGHTFDRWSPPTQGHLKCNVDASFFDRNNATGWSWCLQDHQGRFLLAGSNVIHARLTTIEGEAMAMKEAI
ncbi:polynucleotidyl transferase ribonuclease H fold, partial [Trifolium medium]|nr:polynucleotidyl transferase ribonuclease H fold [Trifolium medium]